MTAKPMIRHVSFAWLLAFATPALPLSGQSCEDRRPPHASLGIGIFHCQAGTCRVGRATATMQSRRDDRLGIRVGPASPPHPEQGRLYDFSIEPRLWEIDADGPSAGRVQDGDALVAVDGLPITTRAAGETLSAMEPGDSIRLSLRREARIVEAVVVPELSCEPLRVSAGAGPRPPSLSGTGASVRSGRTESSRIGRPSPSAPGTSAIRSLGMTLTGRQIVEVGPEGALRWWFAEPPTISRVEDDSPAARAGVPVGALLLQVNGAPVTGAEGTAALASPLPIDGIDLRIRVDGDERTVRGIRR